VDCLSVRVARTWINSANKSRTKITKTFLRLADSAQVAGETGNRERKLGGAEGRRGRDLVAGWQGNKRQLTIQR